MPYYENIHFLPSIDKPTMAGINLTEKGSLAVTMRYPDKLVGKLPLKKDTSILQTRCFKGNRSCRAKGLMEWLRDIKVHTDFTDIEAILNTDNW